MIPNQTKRDGTDGSLANRKMHSYLLLRINAIGVTPANLISDVLIDLSVWGWFATHAVLSALTRWHKISLKCLANILFWSGYLQVKRIAARLKIAFVSNMHSIGDSDPVRELICNPMSRYWFAFILYLSITVCLYGTLPLPASARISNCNLTPKNSLKHKVAISGALANGGNALWRVSLACFHSATIKPSESLEVKS